MPRDARLRLRRRTQHTHSLEDVSVYIIDILRRLDIPKSVYKLAQRAHEPPLVTLKLHAKNDSMLKMTIV